MAGRFGGGGGGGGHGGGGGGWFSLIRSEENLELKTSSWEVIKRVSPLAKPFIWKIIIVLVCIAGQTALRLVPPLISRRLIDEVLPNKDLVGLNWMGAVLLVAPFASTLLKIGESYISTMISAQFTLHLRVLLFAHLQDMSIRFFTNTKTGELMSRLNNDVPGAQRAITGTFINVITNFFTLFFGLIIMIRLEWRLSLLAVGIFPVFILPARKLGEKLRSITKDNLDTYARMNAIITEVLTVHGVLLMKLFGRQKQTQERYDKAAKDVSDSTIKSSVIDTLFYAMIGIVSVVGTSLVYWIGGRLYLEDQVSIGTIIAFVAYLGMVYTPISALINSRMEFIKAMVSFERVFEVLDLPLEIQNPPDSKVISSEDVKGDLKFDSVSFSYTKVPEGVVSGLEEQQRFGQQFRTGDWRIGTDKNYEKATEGQIRWAVRDVSFRIEPGKMCALVGRSGSGKTTMTNLLPRLYDVTDGSIKLDGMDIRDIELSSLNQQIGVVTQDSYLFHDTIRNNLLYAKPNASQEELEEACKAANILEFINDLPEKFNTTVGERGFKLSGSEKQRVSIARVVLKNPRILILDEATSALDSENELLIQQSLEKLFVDRTCLVVAHRLSTILKADQIVVLDKGVVRLGQLLEGIAHGNFQVKEVGRHAELLAQNGVYAILFNTQFKREAYIKSQSATEVEATDSDEPPRRGRGRGGRSGHPSEIVDLNGVV